MMITIMTANAGITRKGIAAVMPTAISAHKSMKALIDLEKALLMRSAKLGSRSGCSVYSITS